MFFFVFKRICLESNSVRSIFSSRTFERICTSDFNERFYEKSCRSSLAKRRTIR